MVMLGHVEYVFLGLDPANSFESFMTNQFVFWKTCWKYSSSNLTGAPCEWDRTFLGDV